VIKLSNNYRDLQDERAHARTIYKTTSTGNCDDIRYGPTPSRLTSFPHLTSTTNEWYYADQAHWYIFNDPENECTVHSTPVGSYPGESPIDIDADNVLETENSTIELTGFNVSRKNVEILNSGHGIEITVCPGSSYDCGATASFGTWPKVLRGISSDSEIDTYYLTHIEIHWGSDNSRGSEHAVCGNSAAAELQMYFTTVEETTGNRRDPKSGLKYVAISTMIEGGATEDNENYSAIFNHIPSIKDYVDYVDIQLDSLLADDYDTKYFTYAGSLTSPPCSQQITWYVGENSVQVSDAQLNLLREAIFYNHAHDTSYQALLFPFVAMVLGTATEHFIDHYSPQVPYTVAILLEGYILDVLASIDRKKVSIIGSGADHDDESIDVYVWPQDDSIMQRSIDMWANIDGHLLLYGFLPALIFGEAMTLNVHMFSQTFYQCLLLACPGVLLGTFATGYCALGIFPYEWSFNFAMVFGSILAATDPVAVVSLLKSVGASSKLTMQITGESLMNDGTAIVLFTLFMRLNDHEELAPADILVFFLQMTIGGPLIGICIGLVAVMWMSNARRRFSYSDIRVQTSITICIAYITFFLAESEAKASGVLCTVTSALVLAKYGWPLIVSHTTIENVWRAIEYFGNTLIFFIAGVISRRAMSSPNIFPRDFGLCIIMYLLVMAIRATMLTLFYPALKRLGYSTNPKDTFFMGWGGLRGAVGLALAIYVKGHIEDEKAGDQLVFHIAGVSFLTLVVNGASSAYILRRFGMIGLPEIKRRMVDEVQKRVIEWAKKDYNKACIFVNYEASDALKHVSIFSPLDKMNRSQLFQSRRFITEDVYHEKKMYENEEVKKILRASSLNPNQNLVKLLRESFLRIVRAHYWEMVDEGHLPATGRTIIELLRSIDISLDETNIPLHDWNILLPNIGCTENDVLCDDVLACVDWVLPNSVTWDNELLYLLNFKQKETAYHICHGFIHGHVHAQKQIAIYHGAEESVDTPEEATVILESLKLVDLAQRELNKLNPDLIKHIKTMFVADTLIKQQQQYIHKLIEQGILASTEAEEILHQLEEDASNVSKARKLRAHAANETSTGDDSGSVSITIEFAADQNYQESLSYDSSQIM